LAKAVFDAVFGLGRIQPLVDDDRVENIMIAGFDRVMVELADGTVWETPPVAESDEELAGLLERLASRSENPRSFTPASPSLHLVLPGRGAAGRGPRHRRGVGGDPPPPGPARCPCDDLVAWGTPPPRRWPGSWRRR
jgi:type IV secretory pathway ATPase VirB11/archaellum biosynthesis ATPase